MTKPNGGSRRPSYAPACLKCGRALEGTYYQRCRICGACYCYSHWPGTCSHAEAKGQLPIKVVKGLKDQSRRKKKRTNLRGHDVIENGEIRSLVFFKPKNGFQDVVGLDKEKEYLRDNVILAIKKPRLFKKYGKRIGTGLILYGAPGVGKTHLVRALAGETGANLVIARLNQIIDKLWGNTEKNIHSIFEEARRNAPAIVFIDELDGLGIDRNLDIGGNLGQYMALTVNQILYEMDGIDSRMERVFVIGATNRPWRVDSALRRSGRFTDSLYIRAPSTEERKALFEFYTRGVPCVGVDYDLLSSQTNGYSPADIEAVCEKVRMLLIKHENDTGMARTIGTEDLIGIIKDDSDRGKAIPRWYSDAKRYLQEEAGTTEAAMYDEILRDLERMTKQGISPSPKVQAYA